MMNRASLLVATLGFVSISLAGCQPDIILDDVNLDGDALADDDDDGDEPNDPNDPNDPNEPNDDGEEPSNEPSGPPLGTCAVRIGDGNVVSWESFSWEASAGHTGGAWYFEVTVEEFEAGWTSIGIAAAPATVMDVYPGSEIAGAAVTNRGPQEVIGVAADLDNGVISFFSNGELTEQQTVPTLPGLGAYTAGALPMSGNVLRFNFGEEGFVFAPPEGFRAYGDGLEADANGDCIGDDGVPSTPAPVTGECAGGYELSSHRSDATGDIELLVVGVYQSAESILIDEENWEWQSVEGEVNVTIDRPGKSITLVVSSYEPTHWIVEATEGTVVRQVLVDRFEEQRVTVASQVEVMDSYFGAYQWPFSTGGMDEQGLVASVEERTGVALTAFAGCYHGNAFHFGADE